MAEDGVTIAKANGFAYNSADGFHDPAQFLNPAKKRHAQPGGKPDDLPSAVNETFKSPAAVAMLAEEAKFIFSEYKQRAASCGFFDVDLWRCKGAFSGTSTKGTYRQHSNTNECGYKMTSAAGIGPHGRMYQRSHALFNEACRTHRGRKPGHLSPLALEAS